MAGKINSYADLRAYLNLWLEENHVDISNAPHGAFWNELSYEDFTTGNVPGVPGKIKILVKGSGKQSNIVQSLMGVGLFDPNTGDYPQMPPGGPYMQPAESVVGPTVQPIVDWIDAGCPN
jgi:hypothetical protein